MHMITDDQHAHVALYSMTTAQLKVADGVYHLGLRARQNKKVCRNPWDTYGKKAFTRG